MRKSFYIIMLPLLLASAFRVIYVLQRGLDAGRGESRVAEEFLYLPDAKYIKIASLGYEDLAADFLWLEAVQEMAGRKVSSRGYEWIYKALDTVTTLDPKCVAPYETGGLILTIVADHVDLSNKILEKGVRNNPEIWQFPFYLGFNYQFFLKDYKKAAQYMSMAAAIKGSPSYLPLLASRLYVQAENPEFAYEFLARMYQSTKDEKMREAILRRMNLVKSDAIIAQLQKAADYFSTVYKTPPSSLDALVRAHIIKEIPEEPNGGSFYITPDGRVKSTKLTENIGIYKK